MMTLTTVAEAKSDTESRVFWRVGVNRKGILDVALDFRSEDCALVAELAAIRHLLFEKQVFGREPTSGIGYQLIVSKGAIKKLAAGKSAKKHASKFGGFLTNRMKGVNFKVSQSLEFMADPAEVVAEELAADRVLYAQTFDAIDTPAMGKVLVTQHAVEQYQQRISSGDPLKPWASLIRRLQHPDLRIQTLDKRVLAHKARKHGRSDNVEAWGHPDSKFVYLCINNGDGEKILVTTFERAK